MSFKITTLMLPAAALAVAMAVPVTVDAQRGRGQASPMRFEGMDTNRDGIISRAEWRGNDRLFANHDWNGDGQLSGPEVRPGAQRNANWEEADHVPNRYERYNGRLYFGVNDDHLADNRGEFVVNVSLAAR